ncbi:MAG: helix-turn-helix transcriptional regulator, partial [Acutalibacteraceae bacterium]|nr:helix-turn-helix transcriptional regulator [Acutalibacteraceae bacterium]
MTFGEKLRNVRLSLNLSQKELAEKTGISERSLYTYEQTSTFPRSGNIRKIAEALNVSVGYLLDEKETDTKKNIDQDIFLSNVKNEYGYK